jgi:hypothetical protein
LVAWFTMRRPVIRPGWVLWSVLSAALHVPAGELPVRPAIAVRGALTEGRIEKPLARRAAGVPHRAIYRIGIYDSFPAAKDSPERVVRFRGRTAPGTRSLLLQRFQAHSTARPGNDLPFASAWGMDRSPRRSGESARESRGRVSPN